MSRVQGAGFRVQGAGCRVTAVEGERVHGPVESPGGEPGCAVPLGDAVGREFARGGEPGGWGAGCGVQGSGLRVEG